MFINDQLPHDTTPEAARVHIEILKKIGNERRVLMGFDLSDQLRAIVKSGIRTRHPEYTDDETRLATIRLCIGDELFSKVYPTISIEA